MESMKKEPKPRERRKRANEFKLPDIRQKVRPHRVVNRKPRKSKPLTDIGESYDYDQELTLLPIGDARTFVERGELIGDQDEPCPRCMKLVAEWENQVSIHGVITAEEPCPVKPAGNDRFSFAE